jgi:hypothetical protein
MKNIMGIRWDHFFQIEVTLYVIFYIGGRIRWDHLFQIDGQSDKTLLFPQIIQLIKQQKQTNYKAYCKPDMLCFKQQWKIKE